MSVIKRIPISELKIGMYIADISNEWIPDTNLRRHGLIKRDAAIEQIRQLGVTDVYIDVDKGADSARGIRVEELNQRLNDQLGEIQKLSPQQDTHTSIAEETSPAARIHSEALCMVSRIMEDVKMGAAIKLQPIEDMADSVTESLRRNASALSCLTRLRHKDEYLIEHSFSVAVLMGILARSMGFNNDDLHQVVTGAFLHDIGKIRVPDEVLNKPGTLQPEEWEEMKRHVQYGEEALAQTVGVSSTVRQICAQHHERLDGSGYPRGLSQQSIVQQARMTAIVDVYDAITAERCYHNAITPTQAMKKLLEWSERHLDRNITYQFIACMSIYPAGSLVELSNGDVGIVVEPNLRTQHQPVIQVVYNIKQGKRVAPHSLNLALSTVKEKILRAVDPGQFGIDLQNYL